jgi:ribonuclease HII
LRALSTTELARLHYLSKWERELHSKGYRKIAGVDEAGRGPLAGPVVAASCVLPFGFLLEDLNDSKKLTRKRRKELFEELTHHPAVFFALGIVNVATIDCVNILQATFLAMQEAIQKLPNGCDYILFDGNQLPKVSLPHQGIVGGDGLSLSIAAASVIAKESRDRLMDQYHLQWPEYGFDQHKGYGTQKHLEALERFGPCEIHRRSFAPINSYLLEGKSAEWYRCNN